MASLEVEPMDVVTKAPAGPPSGSGEADRKDPTASAQEVQGGTVDVDTVLREHHAVPVSTKGAAVLQAMETRKMGAGVEGSAESEVLGSKATPSPASLAAKVQSAAATGVYVTLNADEVRMVCLCRR